METEHLDEIVDKISKEQKIIIEKSREYRFTGNGGGLGASFGMGANIIKNAIFEIPLEIKDNAKALEGYFAHEIIEGQRYCNENYLTSASTFILRYCHSLKNKSEACSRLLKRNDRNMPKDSEWSLIKKGLIISCEGLKNSLKLLIVYIASLPILRINNYFVDREVKKRGYKLQIEETRRVIGEYGHG